MADINYGLIGKFNQVQPGGLAQAFRGGVDLRSQMIQNQRQGQALIADQFANQQAPILADRATQKWNQDLANLQAQEQETLAQAQAKQAEIQQKKIEADQKRYTDSMSIMGRSLYSVNDESQVPVVLNSLKTMADSGVINPDVFYNIPGVKEGRMPTLQEVKVISQSLIDTKDQLIQERENAKAKREAEQQLIDNALKNKEFSLKERQLAENVRSNKAGENIALLKSTAGTGVNTGKPINPTVKADISENRVIVGNLSKALDLLEKNKSGVGRKFSVPMSEFLANSSEDPKTAGERELRQIIGEIASVTIKNTSGAAVSASEEPRLQRWIPYVSDTPEVVKTKLQNFIKNLNAINKEKLSTYSPEMGYETVPAWKDIYSGEATGSAPVTKNNPYGLSAQEQEEFDRLGGSN